MGNKYPIFNKESSIIKEKKFDLHDRLIDFAVRIIKVAEALPNSKIGNHIRGQILKSGTSPAPNYGEAQGAESRSDFIHKLKIALKELRETKVWLLIIIRAELIKPDDKLKPLLCENDELISIIFSSIETAKQNDKKINEKRTA
ncbi:MAG: four helix bundle protein [Calditrichia bacterium]